MADVWATTGYVPGLKVLMSSEELMNHLLARGEYHEKRRDEKRKQLPKLEEATAAIKAHYLFDGDDAVEQLKGDIESHNNKAVAFRWLAVHLFDQDYCLDRSELVTLEILKS